MVRLWFLSIRERWITAAMYVRVRVYGNVCMRQYLMDPGTTPTMAASGGITNPNSPGG